MNEERMRRMVYRLLGVDPEDICSHDFVVREGNECIDDISCEKCEESLVNYIIVRHGPTFHLIPDDETSQGLFDSIDNPEVLEAIEDMETPFGITIDMLTQRIEIHEMENVRVEQ